MRSQTDVVVVGAGVTGLAAARGLERAGLTATVLEAAARPGGQIRTEPFAGAHLDVGAEALHLSGPLVELLGELGLDGELVPAAEAPTWIAADGRLAPLPSGMGPAGPTRLVPLVTAGAVPLRGRLRAAMEPMRASAVVEDDPAAGPWFRRRFGATTTERLVEPLLGGIYSGDIDRMSLLATMPSLEGTIRSGSSLLRGIRRRAGAGSPMFATLRGGLEQLTSSIAADLADVRMCRPVATVRRSGDGYVVATPGEEVRCRGVLVTTPPEVAARILADWPDATAPLGGMERTAVAVVALAYDRHRLDGAAVRALSGTGVLVPRTAGTLLKAATFSSTKWPHLAQADQVVLRASVGRGGTATAWEGWDDDRLVAHVADELRRVVGLPAPPRVAELVRWQVPFYALGHRQRLAAAEAALTGERIAMAGGAYRGVGITACLRQATDAVAQLADTLDRQDIGGVA